MAEEDLNLSDALTDSVPQLGSESTVEKDFVAQLEAETFDDQVKEMVEKSNYVPLLDNDDTRPDRGIALENGEQEAHEVQKSGFSQSEGMGVNMEVGHASLQVEKASNIAELQHPTLPAVACTPKEFNPMLPEPQAPHIPPDLPEGALGECWFDQAGRLSTDPLFMPSVSMGFAKQPGHIAASPDNQLYSCHSHDSAVYAEVDERDVDGSDQKQKKKKKRRQKDGGSYEHFESRGQLEMEENTSPSEGFYHRYDPRRDKGDGWDDQLGRNRGRGKRGKNRKRLPEEWGVMAQPFIPSSEATSQITEEATINQGDLNQIPSKKEVCSEEGLVSQHSSDPITAGSISQLALGSELKATAAPFTLPFPTKTTTLGAFPNDPSSSDSLDILVDSEEASLGHNEQALYSPSFSKTQEASGNIVDPAIYLESSIQDMSESDTSAFSSASKTSLGHSPTVDVLASGSHLSFSDASWQESFDFSNIGASGQSLPLGLSFNTPSPAPLRSPKTTAPEFQPKHKNAVQKQSKKSPILCSPSSDRSFTSPEAPQTSTVITPPTPQSVSTLSVSGSGLNPTAKPFFPSFADPMEYLDVMPEVVPIVKVKPNNMEETEKEEERPEETSREEERLEETEKEEKRLEETEKEEKRPKEIEKEEKRLKEIEEEEKRLEETEKEEKRPKETKEEERLEETEEKRLEETEKEEERLVDSVDKLEPFDTLDKVEQSSVKFEITEPQTVVRGEKEVKKDKKKVKDQEAEKVKEQHADNAKEAEKPTEKMDLKDDTENVKGMETKKLELVHEEEKEEDKNLQKKLFAKEDKTEKVGDAAMIDKVEDKDNKMEKANNEEPKVEETKAGNVNEIDQNEKFKLETEIQTKISEEREKVVKTDKNEKEQKTKVEAGYKHHIDNVETKLEQQPTLVKTDAIHGKIEKKPDVEKQATAQRKDTEKVKAATNQAKTLVKASEVGGPSKKPVSKGVQNIKQEKQEKMPVERKDDKKKTEVKANEERAKIPARPAARSSTTTSKESIGADKKTKPATGAPRPGSVAKSRPNTTAIGGSATATAKCSAPLLTASTKDKKPTPKIPLTAAAGVSRKLPVNSTSRSSSQPSTTTTTHAVKTKTAPEKNPMMPKTSSVTTNQTIKNGTVNRAATHTASSIRTTSSTVTTSNAAIKRPLGSRTDSKPEEKQLSTLKTSTANSTKPKSVTTTTTTTTRSTTSVASRIQTTAAKPVSTEKKLLVPRNPRPTTSATSTTTTNTSKPTGRPSTAPASNNPNVRSKIGSTNNMKQPGGAKVQTLSKKVDVSKVTSKYGTKNGIKDKPAGGGLVKTESHKTNVKEKTQLTVASEDNVSHSASGENIKTEGTQKTTEECRSLPIGNSVPDPGASPTQVENPAAQENGMSKGVPSESEGLLERQPLDSHILETSI